MTDEKDCVKFYSPAQIAVGAFIGTPVAAAFLLARNLLAAYDKRLLSIGAFALVAGGYFLVTLLNPVFSHLLDSGIFVGFTVVVLLANYLLVDGRSGGEQSLARRRWPGVLIIAFLFCMFWIGLVSFVLN
jgi:hypothetical protein